MNYKMMGRFVAQSLTIEAIFMVPALLISVFSGEAIAIQSFLITLGILLAVCAVLFWLCKGAPSAFYAKEGLVCVGISWIALCLFGCLPFVFSGEIPHYVDAFFEIVSGFTTTGASIVPSVENLSNGILYWRSFSHWLGGMGVLVFMMAIVPSSEQGKGFTMHLLQAESPGPEVGKLVPKIRQTAGILYLIYIGLTVLNVIFLLIGRMAPLDAFCTAFGTAGTGGLGIRGDSLVTFSPYIQNVTTVFMILFGVNFSCWYLLLLRQFKSFFRDEELRLYFGIILAAVVLIVLDLRDFYASFGETLRHAFFQVGSIITTTGYASTDFNQWPVFSKTVLLCLMVVGACAGSTGGGFKVIRVLLLSKGAKRNIRQLMSPRRVEIIRNNGIAVSEKTLSNLNAYLAVYVLILFLSFLAISVDGYSIGTNWSVVLSAVNNIGPALDQLGPMENYSGFSDFSKLVLSFDMLAGRLEIFPILVLFLPRTWKSR